MAHGTITSLWIAAGWFRTDGVIAWLVWPALITSVLATSYTGFLFKQGLARDLWQSHLSTVDLLVQAIAEGAAALLIGGALMPGIASAASMRALPLVLIAAMVVHLVLLVFENLVAPSPTRHRELAVSAIRRGPFARLFWGGAIAVSIAAVVVSALASAIPSALALAAALALAGSFAWEYVWVEAGQSVPLS
jgi:Ni/Fe-hydrogenase subunit HybB-like protein